jgi:hypothetical protein
MRSARDLIRRLAVVTWMVGLAIAALTLASSEPVQGAEDLFASLRVHRPVSPGPAPDLVLPTLEGRTVDIKGLHGKGGAPGLLYHHLTQLLAGGSRQGRASPGVQ